MSGDGRPVRQSPTPGDSFLTVAAIMAAQAAGDLDAVADVVASLNVAELQSALRVAAGLARSTLDRRPGGLDLWQSVWRSGGV